MLPLGNPRKTDKVCINTKVCQVPGTQEAQECVQGATLDPHPHFGKVIWKNPETLSGKCQLPLDLGQVPTSLALVGCFYEEPCPPSSQGWRRQHRTEKAGEGPTTCIAFHRLRLRKPVYPLLSWQGWEVSLQGSVDRTKPGYLPSTIVLNFAFLRNCEAPLREKNANIMLTFPAPSPRPFFLQSRATLVTRVLAVALVSLPGTTLPVKAAFHTRCRLSQEEPCLICKP